MSEIIRPWRQARPYRPSWRDHARDVLSILGQATFLLAIFAAIIYGLAIVAAVTA